MAVGDIIHVLKRSTVSSIEAYTHWHIQEGPDFEWLRSLGALEMDRWNWFDPFGEGSAQANRTLQNTYTWVAGADVGRQELSNLWDIPSTVDFPNSRFPLVLCPCITLTGVDSLGVFTRRHLYPFNAGTWRPIDYDAYIHEVVGEFWQVRAQWYKSPIGHDRMGKNVGSYVIWSKARSTWAPVQTAYYNDFLSTQERRRLNRP